MSKSLSLNSLLFYLLGLSCKLTSTLVSLLHFVAIQLFFAAYHIPVGTNVNPIFAHLLFYFRLTLLHFIDLKFGYEVDVIYSRHFGALSTNHYVILQTFFWHPPPFSSYIKS